MTLLLMYRFLIIICFREASMMLLRFFGLWVFCMVLGSAGCMRSASLAPGRLSDKDKEIAGKLSMDINALALLKAKPLYQFQEEELGRYLAYLQMAEPDLAKRIIHLSRKNIGQPFQDHVLGEYPFEIFDRGALFCLDKSDDQSFVEHTYAMALGYDWRSFMAFLQRIRYNNGEIGIASRHHNLAASWLPANSKWLLNDLTRDLVKDKAAKVKIKTSRRQLLKNWDIAQDASEDEAEVKYIPAELVSGIAAQLQEGDLAVLVQGQGSPETCVPLGFITLDEVGKQSLVHASVSGVLEESLLDYKEKQEERNREGASADADQIFGFIFYRVQADPVAKLRALDGSGAPLVSGPKGLLLSRFRYPGWVEPRSALTPKETKAVEKLNLDPDYIALLKMRPLFEFDEKQIGDYLAFLSEMEPRLGARVIHLARKNIGQPYQIFLLGEFPFEQYDGDPLYALHKSDCVVFSEHIYAMALSKNWEEFFVFLQRLRYKDGEIGVLTRNHFTVAEWDTNNAWLLQDLSHDLAGEDAKPMKESTTHRSFFKERYGIEVNMPEVTVETFFVPTEKITEIAGHLQDGDFVNVIYGEGKDCYAGHVGLIARGPDSAVNFLHSTPPRVREESLVRYNEENARKNEERKKSGSPLFQGFKFFRLRSDPLTELRKSDGPDAPVIKGPLGVIKGPGRRWTPEAKSSQ